jgi:hypothetical protein
MEFEILSPPEFKEYAATLAGRLARSAGVAATQGTEAVAQR